MNINTVVVAVACQARLEQNATVSSKIFHMPHRTLTSAFLNTNKYFNRYNGPCWSTALDCKGMHKELMKKLKAEEWQCAVEKSQDACVVMYVTRGKEPI